MDNIGTIIIVVAVITIIASIALAIDFLNRKRYEQSTWKPSINWLFRLVNFDLYLSSGISKFFYIWLTLIAIIGGIAVMFIGEEGSFWVGLAVMVAGPLVIRLVFEMTYIMFSIREQLVAANRTLTDIKFGNKSAGAPSAPVYPAAPAPVRPVAPAPAAAPVRPVAPAAAPRPAAPMGAAPQPARPVAPAPAARRFCPKCGAEVKNGAPFCTNCGTKMG